MRVKEDRSRSYPDSPMGIISHLKKMHVNLFCLKQTEISKKTKIMAEVKPAEVSAILRQQLAGFKSESELQEVGTVLQVGDGIARIYGLTDVQSGELIEFENGLKAIVLNLEEDNIGAVLLGPSKGIKEGDIVKRTKKIASINVGKGMLGRVINTLGTPIDGKCPIKGELLKCPLKERRQGLFSDSQ